MADEALRTGEENETTSVNSGVVGSSEANSEGSISLDDFNRWKSQMDKQVQNLSSQLDATRAQKREADLRDLSDEERTAYEVEELRRTNAELQQKVQEQEAKRAYASQLSETFGIPLAQLMVLDSGPDMMVAAKNYVVAQSAAPAVDMPPPSAGSVPAVGGATLKPPEKDKPIEQVRADALASGDRRSFIASFTRRE